MKILSWDVGIINLGYCILEKNENIIKILEWGIINLMETSEMKKNRNLLFENIPKKLHELPFLLNVDKVVIENQPSLKNPQMKSIQMIVYSYFLMYGKILNNNEYKIKDIDFCNASNKLKVYKGPEILLIKKIKKEKKVDNNLQDIKIELIEEEKIIDHNIIELQGGNNEELIITINKSKENSKENSKEKKIKSIKLSYGDKKKMAVEHVKYFLKDDTKNLEFFLNHKKKDDLADSYLQGLYILNNK
jgi:hypothetical protein